MQATPPLEVEAILEQLREVLLTWHETDTLGEIAIVRGGQEWQVEERPKHRHKAVRRERSR